MIHTFLGIRKCDTEFIIPGKWYVSCFENILFRLYMSISGTINLKFWLWGYVYLKM